MKKEGVLEDLKNIQIERFTYQLPEERIAKFPLADRSASKLLLYDHGKMEERRFVEVEQLLSAGQMLVFNNTKVIHARLFFQKSTGASIEIFCLEPYSPVDYACNFASTQTCDWICLVGNLKKWKGGVLECYFEFQGRRYCLQAEKCEQLAGEVVVRFVWNGGLSFSEVLEACGRIPIPPYLNRESEESDQIRYQTVYSREEGSVAAPTAGLHFTEELLERLRTQGVKTMALTLHVGAGTFRPVKTASIGEHLMHTEHLIVHRQLVEELMRKQGEVVAVGTTSVRTLESLYWMGVKRLVGEEEFATLGQWEVYTLPQKYSLTEAMQALVEWFETTGEELLKARTTIIIVPGYSFRVIDRMFTNFHQPQSTLLLLVGAAVGEEWSRLYEYALAHDFRFLSYGDSCLLTLKR